MIFVFDNVGGRCKAWIETYTLKTKNPIRLSSGFCLLDYRIAARISLSNIKDK